MGDTLTPAASLRPEWRRLSRAKRAALSKTQRREAAQRCAQHLLKAIGRRHARCVAVYLAYGSELSAQPLIDHLHKRGLRVCVPKIRSREQMQFVELRAGMPQRRNHFGIIEPCGRQRLVRLAEIDVIAIPLLAFDAHGRRLGTGGGYYDRLLASHRSRSQPWRVGYAFATQELESLSAEPWDVPLHAVCTEQGLRCFHH